MSQKNITDNEIYKNIELKKYTKKYIQSLFIQKETINIDKSSKMFSCTFCLGL
jgi:hypothetical protein